MNESKGLAGAPAAWLNWARRTMGRTPERAEIQAESQAEEAVKAEVVVSAETAEEVTGEVVATDSAEIAEETVEVQAVTASSAAADTQVEDAAEAADNTQVEDAAVDNTQADSAEVDAPADSAAAGSTGAAADAAAGDEAAKQVADQAANAVPGVDAAPKAPAGFDNYDFNVAGAYAPNGVISRNAPRQLNPFGKAIACVLSVLVALTTWNASSIEVAREMIIGDDATPMASGTGDTLLDDADDDNLDQAANKNDDAPDEGDGADAESGEDGENGEDAENAGDDAAADSAVSGEDMQAYLPKELLNADKVLPQLSDDAQDKKADGVLNRASASEDDLKAAFADRFQFSLGTAGALRATDGVLHVGGSSVTLAPSFGNLAVSLAGGYLGGSEAGDVVALTFNAP